MAKLGTRVVIAATGIGVVAAGLGVWAAYHQLGQRYRTTLETQRTLELEVSALRAERQQLADSLQAERQRASQLLETLSAKDAELQRTVERLFQEEQTIQALGDKLSAMQHQLSLLQGELAVTLQGQDASSANASGRPMVQLERVIVTQPDSAGFGLSDGRVVSVHPQWRFVIVNFGWDDVKVGDIVSIYRSDQLLGRARIERVQEEVSAATLLPDWANAEIQVNDTVRML